MAVEAEVAGSLDRPRWEYLDYSLSSKAGYPMYEHSAVESAHESVAQFLYRDSISLIQIKRMKIQLHRQLIQGK